MPEYREEMLPATDGLPTEYGAGDRLFGTGDWLCGTGDWLFGGRTTEEVSEADAAPSEDRLLVIEGRPESRRVMSGCGLAPPGRLMRLFLRSARYEAN